METTNFYVGFGTQKQLVWSGKLSVIPREGERVVFRDGDLYVWSVVHVLPANKKTTHSIEITLSADRRLS